MILVPGTTDIEQEVQVRGQALLGSESAWGAGSPFPGKNWATWFTFTF